MKFPSTRSIMKIAMLHVLRKKAENEREAERRIRAVSERQRQEYAELAVGWFERHKNAISAIREAERRLQGHVRPELVAADLTRFLATWDEECARVRKLADRRDLDELDARFPSCLDGQDEASQ